MADFDRALGWLVRHAAAWYAGRWAKAHRGQIAALTVVAGIVIAALAAADEDE